MQIVTHLDRFVVLAFKSKEWPFILSEIKRVLKDGGCFQCVEVDMRINVKHFLYKKKKGDGLTWCVE